MSRLLPAVLLLHSLTSWPSLAALAQGASHSGENATSKVDFRFGILPVLSKNCFACHGLDETHREADLRLDDREAAVEFGAIVPGSPEESELFRRITAEDPSERMPPPETGKRLSKPEIDALREWIAAGAKYELHWAYVAPKRPPLPQVSNPDWCRNEVDHFIMAGLDRGDMVPEKEADPYRLIRRLSLDLTGLPPTIEEADAFASSPSDEEYERLVDRYLQSPSYGEHWATKWLDLARYADTCGYEKDTPRTIWPFRDWVIKALNKDMPFDQFTIEQLAGDLLAEPSKDQIIATAFHRNTMQNDEGGADDEEFRVAAVVDRVNTTMQVWMGTTMGCARCHSHKYDPLTHREYFELFAFLNQTADADRFDQEPLEVTPSPEDEKLQAKLAALASENQAEYHRQANKLISDQLAWETAVKGDFDWQPLTPVSATSAEGQTCETLADSSVKVSGLSTASERYTVLGTSKLHTVTALRLEALGETPDEDASSDLSAANQQSFLLSRIGVLTAKLVGSENVRFVRLEIPNRHQYLKMAEVQVFCGDENIALAGTATQSSTAFEGYPQLAIDGSTNPDFGGGRSTAHTAFDFNPWWEVDLGKTSRVDRVALWASEKNQFRLLDARIVLLDAARKPLWQQRVYFAPDMSATFHVSANPFPQIILAGAESQLSDFPATHAIEHRDVERHGWSPDPTKGASQSLYLGFEEPWESTGPTELQVVLEQHSEQNKPREKLRHFRLWVTDDPRAAQAATVPSEVREIANIPADQRYPKQTNTIVDYYRSIHPVLQELVAQRKDLELRKTEELRLDKTPIMSELPLDQQRVTHVHIRGNFLDLGEAVQPGTPQIFPEMPADLPRNRLGLARWLVDRQNPLTARVVANRHWEQLFGIGIVRTSEDFGSQGTLPSHPALLDWLAVDLMDHGWSLKHLTKTLVMSSAYRQGAKVTPAKLAQDPENLLVSRGPSYRLSAEQIRDQALFTSGLLSGKMYGPSVMPYQPDGVWQVVYSDYRWETSPLEDRYRRGLYTYWRRTSPHPSAMALDATSRETCAIRRITTNTPVAALALLNDPAYLEAARNLARQTLEQELFETRARAEFAFRKVLIRPPTKNELNRIVQLHDLQLRQYQSDLEAAENLTATARSDMEKSAMLPELATWTVVGNVLLNLDETLMK